MQSPHMVSDFTRIVRIPDRTTNLKLVHFRNVRSRAFNTAGRYRFTHRHRLT